MTVEIRVTLNELFDLLESVSDLLDDLPDVSHKESAYVRLLRFNTDESKEYVKRLALLYCKGKP